MKTIEELKDLVESNSNASCKIQKGVWGRKFESFLANNQLNFESSSEEEKSVYIQNFYLELQQDNGEEYSGESIRTSLGFVQGHLKSKYNYETNLQKDKNLYSIIDLKLKGLDSEGVIMASSGRRSVSGIRQYQAIPNSVKMATSSTLVKNTTVTKVVKKTLGMRKSLSKSLSSTSVVSETISSTINSLPSRVLIHDCAIPISKIKEFPENVEFYNIDWI